MAAPSTPKVPPWATLASGGASGLASCLLLQPMDFLKTRMQQESIALRKSLPLDGLPRGGPRRRTERLVQTIKVVLKEDGWRGLWRGTVPTVARNVPGVALYFYSVSEIRAMISRTQIPYLSLTEHLSLLQRTSEKLNTSKTSTLANLTIAGNLASGAIARVAVGFLLSPITIVKARFESSHFSKDAYPSLSKALAQIYTQEGVRGLFRGFSATAMRDAPYAGIYLASYEKCKHTLGSWEMAGGRGSGSTLVISGSGESTSKQDIIASSPLMTFIVAGLIAGALATLLTHPFDIIKTRLQTSPDILTSTSKTAGMLITARDIVRVDGMGAFLDGLGLRCARKAASSAIGWTIFEAGRRLWVRREIRRQEIERGDTIVVI